ncbi:MAG TPA: DUF3570 domain-containing protein [Candidatus Polarisedimenticolia bacterium]|nr:DUF3570 domain-containing protein [Candidatus Polarisedimenticolia bacterium]
MAAIKPAAGKAGLLAGVSVLAGTIARADSSIDFKCLYYGESNDRTQVIDPGLYYKHSWDKAGSLGLLLAYDSISGASPTGEIPTLDATASASSAGTIPKAEYTDTRKALGASYDWRWGSHLPSVSLSYSKESDYLSRGISLVDSWELFNKRSTLHFGWGRTWDDIDPVNMNESFKKDSDSWSLGWTQVLGSRDLLDLSFSLTRLSGYLTDPYKLVTVGTTSLPEVRPDTRDRKAAILKLGHYFESRGALRMTYRYYWDDWKIDAHTLGLEFDQRIGKKLILSPQLRLYRQGAASFFAYEFAAPQPAMSSDYRLSSFWSWLVGLGFSTDIGRGASFNLGFTYQEQLGLDRVEPRPAAVVPLTARSAALLFEEGDGEGEGSPGSVSPADLKVVTATLGFSFKF